MKTLAGTSCGARPISTVKSIIKDRDHITSVTSTPLFFTMKCLGFTCNSTSLTRSRSLIIGSNAEMGQTQRGVPVCKGAKSSHKITEVFNDENESTKRKIKGTVVLMKKNVLDFNDFHASFLDRVHELLGQGVSLQLISAVNVDPGELFSFCLVGLCYVFLSLHVFFIVFSFLIY